MKANILNNFKRRMAVLLTAAILMGAIMQSMVVTVNAAPINISSYWGTSAALHAYTISTSGTVDLTALTGIDANSLTITVNSSASVVFLGDASKTYINLSIVIAGGGAVTLDNVNIDNTAWSASPIAVSDDNIGNTLYFEGTNTLRAANNSAAVHVTVYQYGSKTHKLIISGSDGSVLNAIGGYNGTGIGSANGEGAGGYITINGGTINAYGGQFGAGIGGGGLGAGGTVTINDGTVNAYGGRFGAGIGGGDSRAGGIVTINGGTVNAYSGLSGGGIGGGAEGTGGTVTINGGMVNATSYANGGGIGGGYNGTGGTVTINGGTVKASSGVNGTGIGGGYNALGGLVTINGGSVNADIQATPTNGSENGDKTVYLTTVTLKDLAETPVSSTLVSSLTIDAIYTYGIKDMYTDSNGKLYLYFPGDTVTTLAKTMDGAAIPTSVNYYGSIQTKNDGTASGKLAPNHTPAAKSTVPMQSMKINDTVTFTASDIAQDTDGDTLAITAISTEPASSTATASLGVGTVTVTGVTLGSTTMTVTVSDGKDTTDVTIPITVFEDSTISDTAAAFDKYTGSSGYVDIAVTLTLNGNTLSGIYNGAAGLVSGTDYTVSGTTVTIFKTYLATLSNGDTALTFQFSAGANQTLTVTVNDSTPSNSTISDTAADFDKYTGSSGYGDIAVTLTLNGNTLSGIYNGAAELVSGTNYTVSGTTVTIFKTYLATLSNGDTALTFQFSAGANQTLTVTVNDSTLSNSVISDTAAAFDKYTGSFGYGDIAVTLTLNGNTLSGIYNGAAELVSGTDYTVVGTTVTIFKTYLATLSNGDTALTFQFSAGANQILTVTVNDSTPIDDTVAPTVSFIAVDSSGKVVTLTSANEATDLSVSGFVIVTFSETMDTGAAGQISLDGGTTSLAGGTWSVGNTVYTAAYSGLSYSTQYTVTVSGFKDMGGNVMAEYNSPSFTTGDEPLTPSVSTNNLTVNKCGTASFTIAFGQGITAATGAAITVADGSVVSVSTGNAVLPGAITVTGLAVGTTDITVSFNDTASTTRTVTVTVQPIPPVWLASSTLTSSDITTTGATLTWTPAQDNTGVTGYKLYQNGAELATVAGNVYSRTVTGLSSSTSYSFQVQAVNADGVWTTAGPIVTVTTKAAATGGNSNGGSSGSSGYNSTTPAIVPDKKPDQPVITAATLMPTLNKSGKATVTIPLQTITDAIKKAAVEAKQQGKTTNGIGISLETANPVGTKSLAIVLTHPVLKQLIESEVQLFEIDGGLFTLKFDLEALNQIKSQSTGDVTISLTPTTDLSGEAKTLIGKRAVYDITLSYSKDGRMVNITSLGKGSVILSLPYTPGKKEVVGYLFGVYVDILGKGARIEGSTYDANSKSVIFKSNHFSVYGVGYSAPSEKFKDITSHWAKESIDYVIGQRLFSGTSTTDFSPYTAMSRGILVTALGRLADVDVSNYKTISFTDVEADKYYAPYIEWADKNGIVSGVGNSQFAPDRAITREEIALILSNYAKATGFTLPVTREAAAFADNSGIGSIYKEAVTAMQQAGIMMGGNGNKFNPGVSVTRAEVSAMLHRYIKLTIDPATAQGWAVNDAGQCLYYKEGKALTDWQTIGSGASKRRYYFTKDAVMVSAKWSEIDKKWYYFNTDGSLAVSTKVDGYEVDDNGARKIKS